MPTQIDGEITQLLNHAKDGDPAARNRLFEVLYHQLKATAQSFMQGERPSHTLQASALFNEAFLRLEAGKVIDTAQDRRYLIGALCHAMRRVLVDHARGRKTEKRGGEFSQISLDQVCDLVEEAHHCDLVELNDQMERLAAVHARAAQVVELKFFGDLTMDEIATELNVSKSTVESDWRFAQAWLHRQLHRG